MLSAKRKIKIDIAIFSLALLLLVFLGLIPFLSLLAKTSVDIAKKQQTAKFLDNQIAVFTDFQNKSEAYGKIVQKLDSSFVSSEAPIEFIEFLEQEAQKQNLDIIISSVRDDSEKKTSRLSMVFQAALLGKFPQILNFLSRLEKSPWLLKVELVNIDRVNEEAKSLAFKNAQPGEAILTISFRSFSNFLKSVPK